MTFLTLNFHASRTNTLRWTQIGLADHGVFIPDNQLCPRYYFPCDWQLRSAETAESPTLLVLAEHLLLAGNQVVLKREKKVLIVNFCHFCALSVRNQTGTCSSPSCIHQNILSAQSPAQCLRFSFRREASLADILSLGVQVSRRTS